MLRFRVVLTIWLLGIVPLSAQIGLPGWTSAEKVELRPFVSLETIPAGSEFSVAFKLIIEEGWHINAHKPIQDYLIGTELVFGELAGFEIESISYPKPREYRFAFADDPLAVYDGEVFIYLQLRAVPDLPPGDHRVEGALRVQACDDEVCLAPSTKTFEFLLTSSEAGSPETPAHPDIFSSIPSEVTEEARQTPVPLDADSFASVLEREGLVLAFVGLFLVGLALNLTPCVYPMITVTVSLFGSQTESGSARVFLRALIYVLGIATMYSFLGVAAALTGGLFGGLLQSSLVVGLIAFLFFALALSMFGLYEIQVPTALTRSLGGVQTTGIVGLYLSGLIVGVFAAPCIGPPIVALLALVGQKGDPFFGFATFFALSLGLGFPYLILGTFSGLLQRLPRSGAWMVWIKKVMGVVLVTVGFFFLSLATQPQWVFYLVPLTLIAGGIYLGFLEKSDSGKSTFPWVKRAVGTAAIVGGLVFYIGGQRPSLEWQDFSSTALTEARENNRPAVLYFSARWCIPCLELDRLTFTHPKVIEEMNRFVRLKVDLTHYGSPESQELRERYSIAGVPTIIFLDTAGAEIERARIVGFLPSTEFVERIQFAATQQARID